MSAPPRSVDEYVSKAPAEFRPLLRAVRGTVRAAAPKASESISYGIPTYKQDGQRVIYFSAAAKHCAIHMVRKTDLDQAVRLGFGVGRGSIRFTPQHPLPARLLTRIVKRRLAEVSRPAGT